MLSSVILLLVDNIQHFLVIPVHGLNLSIGSSVFAITIKSASITTNVVFIISYLVLQSSLWASALRTSIVSVE